MKPAICAYVMLLCYSEGQAKLIKLFNKHKRIKICGWGRGNSDEKCRRERRGVLQQGDTM